jgi:hypothetical protein
MKYCTIESFGCPRTSEAIAGHVVELQIVREISALVHALSPTFVMQFRSFIAERYSAKTAIAFNITS